MPGPRIPGVIRALRLSVWCLSAPVLLAGWLAVGAAAGEIPGHPRSAAADGPAPLDVASLTAFLERVRDAPPPLRDAEALAHWLQRYGPIEVDRRDACRTILSSLTFGGIPDFQAMTATVEGCPVARAGLTGPPSRMLLTGREEGTRQQDRAEAALARLLGPRLAVCDALDRKVWTVGGSTLVLVDLYGTFGVMLVDASATALDGCSP